MADEKPKTYELMAVRAFRYRPHAAAEIQTIEAGAKVDGVPSAIAGGIVASGKAVLTSNPKAMERAAQELAATRELAATGAADKKKGEK